DDERTRFRYHHLVRDMLHAELRIRDRAREQSLQVRAAEWFESDGTRSAGTGLVRGGRLAEAAAAASAAEKEARRLGFGQHFFAADYLLVLAGLALERRDLDTAEQLTEQVLSITGRRRPLLEFLALLDRAMIWSGRGQGRDARASVEAAGRGRGGNGIGGARARRWAGRAAPPVPGRPALPRRTGQHAARRPARPAAGQDRAGRRRLPRRATAGAGIIAG